MRKKLLVCDLDNTLYDWVAYFVPSFYAMVDEAVRITGCNREQLLDDFRTVHQREHDSEKPFALLKTGTIRSLYGGLTIPELRSRLDSVFHAFNSARKKNLALYPTVRGTLDLLAADGVILIAHTESKLFGVVDRLRRLNLTSYFSRIYCRKRSLDTDGIEMPSSWFDGFPMEKIFELSHHQAKPSRSVLLEICDREGISPDDAAYVGDSIARDVLMAKRAGVFAIWAKYGANHDQNLYSALVRVSHWTATEVAREKQLSEEAASIAPDYIAENTFSEVLCALGESTRTESFDIAPLPTVHGGHELVDIADRYALYRAMEEQ